MNRLSKSYQCRPKNAEPKEEKPRAFNSTMPAPSKPMNRVSVKGRKIDGWDAICADEALSRDGYICIACKWLWGKERPAEVVHHIQGKNTHHGPERRFMLLWQVSLCNECHADTESQNGHSRWLDIGAFEDVDNSRGTQLFKQTKVVDGQRVTKEAARPNVANWNPLREED